MLNKVKWGAGVPVLVGSLMAVLRLFSPEVAELLESLDITAAVNATIVLVGFVSGLIGYFKKEDRLKAMSLEYKS